VGWWVGGWLFSLVCGGVLEGSSEREDGEDSGGSTASGKVHHTNADHRLE